MDSFGEMKDEFLSGHKLNGSNYRLWKFQFMTYMKANALTKNIQGNVPAEGADEEELSKYERNEGKAMNAIIKSLDNERANFVLTCTSAKEMMDKLNCIYEKNSEIRVMTLYEEYFSLKMRDDESVANHVAKVNQLAYEIEQHCEKLSDKLKMVRIISSLPEKFNNYKTVWYNTNEIRSIGTLMSSLQLEEDNLNRINGEQATTSDIAFDAKVNERFLKKSNIDEIKKKTKCNACGKYGHWAKDKECQVNRSKSYRDYNFKTNNFNNKNDRDSSEMAWSSTINSNKKSGSDHWFADSGTSSHMTNRREWFSDLVEYTGNNTVKIANNSELKICGVGTILIDAKVNNQWEPRRLENVLYFPDIKENLFSTALLTDKGLKVVIEKDGCKAVDKFGKTVAHVKRFESNQLKMDFRLRTKNSANSATI